MPTDENIIRYQHQSGINGNEGSPIPPASTPWTTNNQATPGKIRFNQFGGPQTPNDDPANPQAKTIFENMLGILENIWDNTGGAVIDFLSCQGGKRRGWKIDSNGVSFAPCGCYVEAVWPHIVGVGIAVVNAKAAAIKILKKLYRNKASKILNNWMYVYVLQQLSKRVKFISRGINLGVFISKKAPPVQPGFTRLYRGVGSKIERQCNGQLPVLPGIDGRYWTPYIEVSEYYAKSRQTDDFFELSTIYYVDVPTDTMEFLRLDAFTDYSPKLVYNISSKTLAQSPNGIPLKDLSLFSGDPSIKKYQQIAISDTMQSPVGLKLDKNGPMPIIREVNGEPHLVYAVPTPADKAFNPHIFAGDKRSGLEEVFLDNGMFDNKAIAAFTDKTVAEDLKCALDPMLEDLNLFMKKDIEFLENENFRTEWLNRFQQNFNKWSEAQELLTDNFDTTVILDRSTWQAIGISDQMAAGYKDLFDLAESVGKDILDRNGWLLSFLASFLAFMAFIEIFMNATSIVVDKKCNTTLLGMTLEEDAEAIYDGTGSLHNKYRIESIRRKLPVPARMNPDTCACSECPQGYGLCDKSSITNLWDDRLNTCFPSCCGGKELKPITLKSDCGCECPPGYVFQKCQQSNCLSHVKTPSYLLYWLTGELINLGPDPFLGSCFPANPNPDKLDWDPITCSYICKDYKIEFPFATMGAPVKVPLPPCEDDKIRTPAECDCLPKPSSEPHNLIGYIYNEQTDSWETRAF